MKDEIAPECISCVKDAIHREEHHPEGVLTPPNCLRPIEDLNLGLIIKNCPILAEVIENKLAEVEPRIKVEYKKRGGKYDKICHIKRNQVRAKLDELFYKFSEDPDKLLNLLVNLNDSTGTPI